jgi:NAD(P)-dependent dehydrogenase (short-subunit alcohol dehydrogenase family)
MARVFITGSAGGLGLLTAKALALQGHKVVLHARNNSRGKEAIQKVPGAETVLIGDLTSIEETQKLAEDVNTVGLFDAVIHNAGVYRASHSTVLAVNTLAPYILTCLIQKPKRLIYLSSGLHLQGKPGLVQFATGVSYPDSKLHMVMLSNAVARKWNGVFSNSVNPGWVPTKMGGAGAPDDLQKGWETQVWLAVSDSERATVSGRYFFHQKETACNTVANDVRLQESLLSACEKVTGVAFP